MEVTEHKLEVTEHKLKHSKYHDEENEEDSLQVVSPLARVSRFSRRDATNV